jgi:hypothetical protein
MARQRKKLFWLILIQVVLVCVHQIFLSKEEDVFYTWHYWLAMIFFIYLCGYILFLRCPNPKCNAPQIYCGVDIRTWRLPDDTCWKCGGKIK